MQVVKVAAIFSSSEMDKKAHLAVWEVETPDM